MKKIKTLVLEFLVLVLIQLTCLGAILSEGYLKIICATSLVALFIMNIRRIFNFIVGESIFEDL